MGDKAESVFKGDNISILQADLTFTRMTVPVSQMDLDV